MSRQMERKAVSPFAQNVLVPLLTVPAGHKYELLNLLVYVGSGTTIVVLLSITAGATTVTAEAVPSSQGQVVKIVWNALCLDEGDVANIILSKATGGGGSYHLTYMDVAF